MQCSPWWLMSRGNESHPGGMPGTLHSQYNEGTWCCQAIPWRPGLPPFEWDVTPRTSWRKVGVHHQRLLWALEKSQVLWHLWAEITWIEGQKFCCQSCLGLSFQAHHQAQTVRSWAQPSKKACAPWIAGGLWHNLWGQPWMGSGRKTWNAKWEPTGSARRGSVPKPTAGINTTSPWPVMDSC